MSQKEIRRYLSVIKRAVPCIEGILDGEGDLLEKMVESQPAGQPPVTPAVHPVSQPVAQPVSRPVVQVVAQPVVQPLQPDPAFVAARKKHISDLMAIDCWPEAMPAFFSAKEPTKADQINRANAVLDMMIDRSLEGMHFLDYGCGDGWVVQEASKRGVASAIGYDIVRSEKWSGIDAALTDDMSQLKNGFYDVVFLYDVLDHAQDPLAVMADVKRRLRQDGAVYVRCHPWTSRHASHLFRRGLNKAYIHLFLKWHEICELIGGEPMFTREEKSPSEAYKWWFHDFVVKKERQIKEPVSEFFHVPAFKQLLADEQGVSLAEADRLLDLMQVQFIDWRLAVGQ